MSMTAADITGAGLRRKLPPPGIATPVQTFHDVGADGFKLTSRHGGPRGAPCSDVLVCPPIPDAPGPLPTGELRPFVVDRLAGVRVMALFDTGATHSSIAPGVARALGLNSPTGQRPAETANGHVLRDTHTVMFGFQSGWAVELEVSEEPGSTVWPGINVIVGCDVICLGEFNLKCEGGQTVFSFRIPVG